MDRGDADILLHFGGAFRSGVSRAGARRCSWPGRDRLERASVIMSYVFRINR